MENLDPSSATTQHVIASEILRSASSGEVASLGQVLKVYDATIAKHGISATDLVGIQIYRSLLQWGRQGSRPRDSRRTPLAQLVAEQSHSPSRLRVSPRAWQLPHGGTGEESLQKEGTQTMETAEVPVPRSPSCSPRLADSTLQPRSNPMDCRVPAPAVAPGPPAPQEATCLPAQLSPAEAEGDLLPNASSLVSAAVVALPRPPQESDTVFGRSTAEESSRVLADAYAYRKNLARAVLAWCRYLQQEAAAQRRLQQKQALQSWHRQQLWSARCAATTSQLRASLRLGRRRCGMQRWSRGVAARRSFRRQAAELERLQQRSSLKCAVSAWMMFVRFVSGLVEEALLKKRRQLMQVTWQALRGYTEQRQLMKLYQSWADVHWLRGRLSAAWQAWLRWFRKRGKVVAMRSPAQLLAAWRWLRVHAAAHPQPLQPCRRQRMGQGGERSEGPARRRLTAAELLYNPAPFEVHPHHMKAVQRSVLDIFASAVLKKILDDWHAQARDARCFSLRVQQRSQLGHLRAWQARAIKCRRLHACHQQVAAGKRSSRIQQALQSWTKTWVCSVQHRRRAQDFAVACWHRTCRRALDAWLLVRRWEASVARSQRAGGQRLLGSIFQAWLAQWHYDRQESVLLRLSGLFLRKCSLRRGLRLLGCNVRFQSRRRQVQQAEAELRAAAARRDGKLLEACWAAWRSHAESRRLMKLYQSWADVHWLRGRLSAAWQAWLRWFQKRGKVVAMRSPAQLLAAWRWLRVHAAAHPRLCRMATAEWGVEAPAGWWEPAAAGLLFGSAPFEVHAHHMQVLRPGLLRIFASVLTKKMLAGWMLQVVQVGGLVRQAQQRKWRSWLTSWKGAAATRRRARQCQHQVLATRCTRACRRAVQRWKQRWARKVLLRRRSQDFAVACWHRCCRRALGAWVMAHHWEASAARAQRTSAVRLVTSVFQAWAAQWREDRQEAARLRLSALCLRKRSLQRGLSGLRTHVCEEVRHRARQKVREAAARARRALLEACWSSLLRYSQNRRLMKLYRSWADVHWLRGRLSAAWQAWLRWFRKRGKVVAMHNPAQLLAAWRWLRVHAAARPLLPRRWAQVDCAEAPAGWWQPAAAELLFGSAPFEVHAHHMQAMRHGLLAGFASALLRKMLAGWLVKVQAIRAFILEGERTLSRRWLRAWKAEAAQRRHIHNSQHAVAASRGRQEQSRALRHWRQRCTRKLQRRRQARDLAAASRRRTCARAFRGWQTARHLEASASKAQRASARRLLGTVLQAWVAQWHSDRQEAALLRLSTLCLRKRRLQRGLRALRRHVRQEARQRAVASIREAAVASRRRLLEVCWAALVRYSEQQQLTKLYQSWADVHRLRTRLAIAWQAWVRWFRKRGKVVAMQSPEQLLAAWRWLRVHAAARSRPRSVLSWDVGAPPGPGWSRWWQPAAAELLFGSAPFEVHVHHMQAMGHGLLAVFASALLKKMLASWLAEVRTVESLLQVAKHGALQRSLRTWQARSQRKRSTRHCQQLVLDGRGWLARRRALHCWKQRCLEAAGRRQKSRLLLAASARRRCRRALEAWQQVRRRQVAAASTQQAAGQRLLRRQFQAWARRWRHERQVLLVERKLCFWHWRLVVAARQALTAAFRGWLKRWRRGQTVRCLNDRLALEWMRSCGVHILQSWMEAARSSAVHETLCLLQADDVRRRSRRKATLASFGAWRAESQRLRRLANMASLRKVFGFWRLAVQEHVLLEKYLRECAAINLQGKEKPSASVGPADLERVYREMAELRWAPGDISD